MPSIRKRTFLLVAQAMFWVATPFASPQQAHEVLPAPVPAQIRAGKKVFISNGGGDRQFSYSGGPQRLYNQFYAAIKDWARYEIVGSPAEADLVFEISFSNTYAGLGDQFRLVILDPGTRVVLWPFTERIAFASRQANRDKNFDQALNLLVNDVRNAVGQPFAASNNKG